MNYVLVRTQLAQPSIAKELLSRHVRSAERVRINSNLLVAEFKVGIVAGLISKLLLKQIAHGGRNS
jgi:hypothetical protein